MSFDELHAATPTEASTQAGFEVDVTRLSSAVLARLVNEVKNDDANVVRSYDRVHNRHNR
jgi:hypothetical protein